MLPNGYSAERIPADGVYDESAQYWLIRKQEEFEERPEIGFLEIGGPGVDGIGFGLRKGMTGIWAYYPIDNEFELKASDLEGLLNGWREGTITV